MAVKKNSNPKKDNLPKVVESDVRRSFLERRRFSVLGVGLGALLLLFLAYRFFVLAWVDRVPVTRLQLDKRLENKFGKETTEQIISETLLLSEARRKNTGVSKADLDREVKKITDQQGGQDKLNQILQVQNMSMDEFRDRIRYQLLIEKMFGGEATVSAQEVDEYIQKNKDQFPETINDESSESAKLKTDIVSNLKRQKVGKVFNDWLQKTLSSPRVKRL